MIEEYLTNEQIEELQAKNPNRKGYSFACLYSTTLDDGKKMHEDMDFEAAIVWYSGFKLKANQFPKIECPICHKKEILPYFLGASILSGSNKFKGYCFNCKTKLAFNSSDYYHLIRDSLIKRGDKEFLFTTYTTEKTNDCNKIVEDLFLNISNKELIKEAVKLNLQICGAKDMKLKDITEISNLIAKRFDNKIEIAINTNLKAIGDETCVKLFAYKEKTKEQTAPKLVEYKRR